MTPRYIQEVWKVNLRFLRIPTRNLRMHPRIKRSQEQEGGISNLQYGLRDEELASMRGFGGVVSSSSAIIIKPQIKCCNTVFCS